MPKDNRKSKLRVPAAGDTALREARAPNDTIRLWENYREQALLWRALALIQVPSTVCAILFAYVMFSKREVTLQVPAKPLPGYYLADEIPDEAFVGRASDFVNLIATYQPTTAQRQFQKASEYLIEPVLTTFIGELMKQELQAIQTTSRTQVYWIDPEKTDIERDDDSGNVVVTFSGERRKLVAGQAVPDVVTTFTITMTTVPRNPLNEFGIMINNVASESSELQSLKKRVES
jgi:hypothetical protein